MSRVIVAGSRNLDSAHARAFIFMRLNLLRKTMQIKEIVCGGAVGPDTFGREWAIHNEIPVKEFPADWKKHGKKAGLIRNDLMANYADCLVAYWDRESRGTFHMIQTALNKGLEVHVYQTT